MSLLNRSSTTGPTQEVRGNPPGGGGLPPFTSVIGKAPRLGKSGGSNLFSFYKPNDYKSGESRTANRSNNPGDVFAYVPGNGPYAGRFGSAPPVTDTIGFMTNYTVPYAKAARSFKKGMDDISQLGQLMLCKKQRAETIVRGNRAKMLARRYTLANIVMFNYKQANSEVMPKTPEEVRSAMSVWNDWSVEGIVKSEEGFAQNGNKRYEDGKEYILNTTIRGAAYTFNIWDNCMDPQTKLFLILKKPDNPIDGIYNLAPFGEVERISGIGRTLTDRPFQLFPYAKSGVDFVPDEELIYYDEFNNMRRGVAIYVGCVDKAAADTEKRTKISVTTNIESIVSQPQIFIFVDPDF